MTEAFTRFAICSLHSRAKGKTANIQSVVMETAATRNERAVWISRGLHSPAMRGCQFFLFHGQNFPWSVKFTERAKERRQDDLLDRRALEEEIHAGAARANRDEEETAVDDPLHPPRIIRDAQQGEAQAPLQCDEGEAPELLKNVEPLYVQNRCQQSPWDPTETNNN